MTRGCKPGLEPLWNVDWLEDQPGRCFFYPGRDCPGWEPGGICSRIERPIPKDDDG